MKNIKIQCPAKINLSLKIKGKRPDGFHEIESIMQTINLYDYLTIGIEKNSDNIIELSGTNPDLPYDSKNLVYKATELFFRTTKINNIKTKIHIEKNIPISAGLAGGSTDAAGALYGLNKIFDNPLPENELHNLCSQLGSDLNVCLKGGRILAQGRGEIITPLEFEEFNLSIIKPNDLGISAKEAYTKFSQKINSSSTGREDFVNDLEWAIIDDYKELQHIKQTYPKSIMTGSGSAYYIVNDTFENEQNFYVINNLKSIPNGIKLV